MFSLAGYGGAIVRRRFEIGHETVMPGDYVELEALRKMPRANLNALIEQKKLELYPIAPAPAGSRRYVVHMGMGKFDVIEGHRINERPLTRAEAEGMVSPDERPKGRLKKKKTVSEN